MDFNQYIKDNVLSVQKSTINMKELVGFLKDSRNVTKLMLNRCSIDNKDAKEFTELTSISSLELIGTKTSIEGVKALAKLPNLIELKLSYTFPASDHAYISAILISFIPTFPLCMFLANPTFLIESEFGRFSILTCVYIVSYMTAAYVMKVLYERQSNKCVEALAHSNLINLTSLDLSGNEISDKAIEALANGNLTSLTSLDLHGNKISDKGIKALANGNLISLTSLDLGCNKISDKAIEALAKSHYLRSIACGMDCNYHGDKSHIHKFLVRLYCENKSVDNFNPDSIKEAVFSTARLDYKGEAIKYVLERSNKYPFLINSKDKRGRTLFRFYNHSSKVQQLLFEHGLIPEKKRNRGRDAQLIALDDQSTHASPVVKRINFFTKKLVESLKVDKEQLKQAAASYMANIPVLLEQYYNDPIRLKLLSLTESEKRSVMEETLLETDPIPGDEEFIKTVIDEAQQYLKKNFHGEYDREHPTQELQYDYTRDDAKITIPESIGYIKLLIDNFSVPLKEKKELLVTLMEQNPDLVKNKLSKVKEKLGNSLILDKEQFNKVELHGLLNGIDDGKKVDELFKEISELDIEKIWREQKEFILLKQIYMAATAYGEGGIACPQGAWSQIISSINEISTEILIQYDRYLEEEQKLEMQKNVITEENIRAFVENLAKKLIQYVEGNPELEEILRNHLLSLEHIDVDYPEKVTFGQQKILAKINQEFTKNITKFLVNYGRSIPKEDEYEIITKELFETQIMRDFALKKDDQPQILTQSQSVYSKIGIGCGVVIAIGGVALGVAIAVHLEMLAVGIAVGACCLVAAAIYCRSGPSNSLEKSSAVTATIGPP
ncbi:MAG: hypothetical protein O7157_00910 [Wolbachia endosymbiont of Tetragnatha montana]|nr:hypothetical protein [Wolbachia endosymbiont of Tetragnatha montana]